MTVQNIKMSLMLRVGFLTDVEGNLNHFLRYVSISSVLQWADQQCSKVSKPLTFATFHDTEPLTFATACVVHTLVRLCRTASVAPQLSFRVWR